MTIRTGVVLTAYRQAAYLGEAVGSALAQGSDVGVVAVNDGCPQPETHEILLRFRRSFPDRFQYLRTPNRGQSAAINAGVEQLRRVWPLVGRVFFLDADNLMKPGLLRRLGTRLEADPGASWAYPDLEVFGAEEGALPLPTPFSRFRQAWENQTDNGSLVRMDALTAHSRFVDIHSLNDWAFFLSLALEGGRGVSAGRAGMGYRKHGWSMLSNSRARAGQLRAAVWSKLPAARSPHVLLRLEHLDQPRYGVFDPDGEGQLLTDPGRPRAATTLRSTLRQQLAEDVIPPSVLVVAGPRWGEVPPARRPGLLLLLQAALAVAPLVGAQLHARATIHQDEPDGSAADLWAVRADTVEALVAADPPGAPLLLRLPILAGPGTAGLTTGEVLGLLSRSIDGGVPTPRHDSSLWALWRQVDQGETLLPYLDPETARPVHVAVAVDDDSAASLGPAVAALAADDGVAVHLLVVGAATSPAPEATSFSGVATATVVPDGLPGAAAARRAVLARADVALIATAAVLTDVELLQSGSPPRWRIVANESTVRSATALVRRLEQIADVLALDQVTADLLVAAGAAPSTVTLTTSLASAVHAAVPAATRRDPVQHTLVEVQQ